MDSAKLIAGVTAEVAQYNSLRKDALLSGFVNVESLDTDSLFPITTKVIGDSSAVEFAKTTAIGYFDVKVPPNVDTTLDWSVKIAFDMSSSMAGNVRLSLDYYTLTDAGDSTPAAVTLAETVACPATLEVLKTVTLSTIKIPAAAMVAGNVITFKLSRLGLDALDTHTGNLRIFSLQLFQTQT